MDAELEALRHATRTGRPCGSEAFVRTLEDRLARLLAPQKRGPKGKAKADPAEDLLNIPTGV